MAKTLAQLVIEIEKARVKVAKNQAALEEAQAKAEADRAARRGGRRKPDKSK